MMRMSVAVALVAAFTSVKASAATSTWNGDPEHSSAQFAIRHLGLSTVRGEMGTVKAMLTYDDTDVTKSKVEATIDTKAINTREAKRDTHLKSDAFFNVEKYPEMKFVSTKITKVSKGKLKVTGDLTIRDKTKSTTLDVEFPGTQVTAYGDTHMSASATGKINRQDYGVSWNTTVDTGGLLVGDEVTITLDVEFIKAKTDAAAAASPAATKPK